MVKFFHFFSCFNNAYNNKFKFFYFKNFENLNKILKMFMQRGLILGFVYIQEKVFIHLRYIKNNAFFRIVSISKPGRRITFKRKHFLYGRFSGSDLYILNSPEKGFYFSDSFKDRLYIKQGGDFFLKILFNNENNFSKKNTFF